MFFETGIFVLTAHLLLTLQLGFSRFLVAARVMIPSYGLAFLLRLL